MTTSKLVFISDGPPLKDGGFGNSGIAFSFCNALGDAIAVILTRQHHWTVDISAIGLGLPQKLYLYRDLSIVRGLRRLSFSIRSFLDTLLFLAQFRRVSHVARTSGASRIFALCGNDPLFLINAVALSRLSRLPLDVYLVDDTEASALMIGKRLRGFTYRLIEKWLLPKMSRVFVISRGYGRHLEAKYGIPCQVLPVPVRYARINYRPLADNKNKRAIGFSGSLNQLYLKPLVELCKVIDDYNMTHPEAPVGLRLFTKADRAVVRSMLGNKEYIEVLQTKTNAELVEALAACIANFLPYTDEDSAAIRTMVQTSFSCKISEYYAAGRPIIAYGPTDSTTNCFFRENAMDICVSTSEQLADALRDFQRFDNEATISKYQDVIHRFHSPDALARQLFHTN